MVSPPSGLPAQGQNSGDQEHGGDEKYILSENCQTGGGDSHTNDGGEVVFGAEPLLHKNGDKQGGQDKFDALVIDGEQVACQRAQQGAGYPVDVVKH